VSGREGDAVRELTRLVEARIGHVVPDRNLPFLEEAVRRRVAKLGLSCVEAYVARLSEREDVAEWEELLRLVLVHESYLFRGRRQLEVLVEAFLPDLVEARREARSLAFWSAGCSRGEEAVTLAVLLADRPELDGWDWRILATDVDSRILEEARSGLYEGRAVREVPAAVLARFFVRLGEERYRVRPEILARIEYRELNLVKEPLDPPGAPFDAILIRNVLIYFRPESQRRVVEAMAGLVAPHGIVVPGPSESLWQIVDSLRPVESHGIYFYRPRSASPVPDRTDGKGNGGRNPGQERSVVSGRRLTSPGVDRKRGTTAPLRNPGRARSKPQEPPCCPDGVGVRDAVEALVSGRFEEARTVLAELASGGDAPAMVHALDGLLAELLGEPPGTSVRAYRRVLFLEPGWFQVRLLLADLLWATGDRRRAAVEYRRVLREAGMAGTVPFWNVLGLPDRAAAREHARARLRPDQERP